MPPHDANPLTGQHSWQEFRAARGRYLARSSDSRPPHPLSDRVESLVAAWNTHDPDGIAAHFTVTGVRHQLALPEIRLVGRTDIAIGVGAILHGVPDCGMAIHAQTSSGDERVTLEWILTGTHENHLLGLPPSGTRIRLPGVSVITFDPAFQIAQERVYWDAATLIAGAGGVD